MKRKARIIMTGGNGFIASALIPLLKKKGFPVTSIESTDFESIAQGDVVIHLACTSLPAISENDRIKDIEENLIGTIKLLDACVQKKASKLVYLSTGGAMYDDKEGRPSKESDPINPKNSYGALKASIERYIAVYGNLYGLKYVIVRPGNIYGRSKIKSDIFGAVDVFAHKALFGEEITILGDGETVRDYIHISDAAEFISRAATTDLEQGVYNLGTGNGTSLNEILLLLQKSLGKDIRVKRVGGRKSDARWSVLDISKALSTGWKPRFPRLEQGIAFSYGKKKIKRSINARKKSRIDFE
jgi:UDP-glucose 4-epimerase